MEPMRLDFTALQAAYRSGETPVSILSRVYSCIEEAPLNPVWISLVPRETALARAAEIMQAGHANLPLYGIPFAVKDNMDVAGMETTAACPAFAYTADTTAAVVKRLEEAGAILVGKTNMDQFATGLVGVRSPYGACSSVFDAEYLSGGSSSGSAVAVASGLVSFSLGTDTAGSGRVPAAFNNLIGLKPTRGTLSTSGIVPACRSLDCVSIFALTSSDAEQVVRAARSFDASDPYSRPSAAADGPAPWLGGPFRFGVPKADQWEFFGDAEAKTLYEKSIRALEVLGGTAVEFDLNPFQDAAVLLYSGPWVAERLAALGDFIESHAEDMHPVVRGIITGGARFSAVDAFLAQYKLEGLRRRTSALWDKADLMLLPTTGTIYTLADVEADPIRLNSNLGCYTNFVNLLDLAAVALPAGFRPNGLPFGVSLIGPAQTDLALLSVADRLHRHSGETLGGLPTPLAETALLMPPVTPPGCTLLAVVGAHLTGEPLNRQLTERGARLTTAAKTAVGYRLYALANTLPAKPGLVRAPGFEGPGIDVEVWAMPTSQFGSFVAEIPAPLGIGSVELADGSFVTGFICELFAVEQASEITQFGGWRPYLSACRP
ncbi:MAG: allophanate hydrolase [Janthinobacterium lividum]